MNNRYEYPNLGRDEFGHQKYGLNGRPICRGCGVNEVPKGRQTWCSEDCYNKHEPKSVRIATWNRDDGICQRCHLDLKAEYVKFIKEKYRSSIKYSLTDDDDSIYEDWHPTCRIPIRDDCHYGYNAEFDHIIPWSEGGRTVLENMRTLCIPCHKKVTAEWHFNRAKKRKPQLELSI